MDCSSNQPPLLLDKSAGSGFGRSESAHRVPGRIARKHWAGMRRIKSNAYIPLIPTFSLKGEGAGSCVNTYVPTETTHQSSCKRTANTSHVALCNTPLAVDPSNKANPCLPCEPTTIKSTLFSSATRIISDLDCPFPAIACLRQQPAFHPI